MTNTPNSDPSVSANVLDMFTVANEFCIFTEKADKYNQEEVLQYYAKICPLLYLKGAILPVVEADEDYFGERFVNEDQWENIYNALLTVFPGKDEFFTLSYENADNMPLKASISGGYLPGPERFCASLPEESYLRKAKCSLRVQAPFY
jgi:hypothetical protein